MNTDQNSTPATAQTDAASTISPTQLPLGLQNIFNRLKNRNNNTNGAFGGKRKHNGVRGFKRAKKK